MNHDDDDAGPEIPGLRGLKLDQAPERDLWPGIESRLKPVPSLVEGPRRGARWTLVPMALAASLALAIGLRLSAPMQVVPPEAPASSAALARAAPLPLVAENRALVMAHLKIVDGAETQLMRALQDEPDSASLQRLLTSTRGQRRELRRLLAA